MKKLIVFLLLVLTPIMAIAVLKGDVDGNDKVGSSDYVLVRKHLTKQAILTGERLERADANTDGKVSSLDYIAIRKTILNGSGSTITPTAVPVTSTPIPTSVPTNTATATPTPTATMI